LTRELPFPVRFRTDRNAPEPAPCVVLDSTGELASYTPLADVVFVGKSLPPSRGGQSPVDALVAGIPVVFGPHMENFRDLSRDLIETGAATPIDTAAELAGTLEAILSDTGLAQRHREGARHWRTANTGATRRTVEELVEFLELTSRT